jgi:hypothetical protein
MARKPLDLPAHPPDPRAGAFTRSSHDTDEFLAAAMELQSRSEEALALYEPTPFQEAFHACPSRERLIQAGNQVGKSLAAFVEVARALTGQDPHNKYPTTDGVAICLGIDEKHIGRVIHKYLFRKGAFRIIRDKATRKWRAWKPWIPEDAERRAETRPAPPLIPERFIKKWAMTKAAKHIFETCEFHNGWVLHAYSSNSEPAGGFQADLAHIDEDIMRPDWYDELIARLSMRNGKLIWSALPLAKNDALCNVIERAEDEASSDKPTTSVFRASIFDNPYMPEEAKQENIKRWRAKGDDEYRKRALGELVVDSILMYPTFSKTHHSCIKAEDPRLEIQRILTDRNGTPPDDWTRYMIVDPGHTVCAALFFATPPPELGDFRVCYDELYIQQADAKLLGIGAKSKCGEDHFEDFIIDMHGGRIREIGSGELPVRQYERHLADNQVICEKRGSRFLAGCDDVESREGSLREWLMTRRDGTTKFLINPARCPHTCREMSRFKKLTTTVGGQLVPTDKGNRKANTHCCECLEYGAAHGLDFVPHKSRAIALSPFQRRLAARVERKKIRLAKSWNGSEKTITLGPQGS